MGLPPPSRPKNSPVWATSLPRTAIASLSGKLPNASSSSSRPPSPAHLRAYQGMTPEQAVHGSARPSHPGRIFQLPGSNATPAAFAPNLSHVASDIRIQTQGAGQTGKSARGTYEQRECTTPNKRSQVPSSESSSQENLPSEHHSVDGSIANFSSSNMGPIVLPFAPLSGWCLSSPSSFVRAVPGAANKAFRRWPPLLEAESFAGGSGFDEMTELDALHDFQGAADVGWQGCSTIS